MRMVLDGTAGRGVSFNIRDYVAIDYGYAANVHKAAGRDSRSQFRVGHAGNGSASGLRCHAVRTDFRNHYRGRDRR